MNYVIDNKDLDEVEKYLQKKEDGKAINQLNRKPSSNKSYVFLNKKSRKTGGIMCKNMKVYGDSRSKGFVIAR